MSVDSPLPALDSRRLRRGSEQLEETHLPPSVSIVITTYNHAQFLAEAIESALAQTTPPDELIVVDDGSTDNPGSVVSRYSQVRLIRQHNQGLAAARNTGWRAARGHYVVFLDADDRLLPEALSSNLQRFLERPECAFVYGSYHFINSIGEPQDWAVHTRMVGEDAYASFLAGNCVSMHATVMYRRDCLAEVGGFDERLRRCEDYEIWLRLARQYRVAAGSDRIAEYRRHENNMTLDFARQLETVLKVMHQQRQYMGANAQWRRALTNGIRDLKSTYAEAQVSHILSIALASGASQVPWRGTMRVFGLAPAPFVSFVSRRALTFLRSRMAALRRKPVRFGDLRRLRPISTNLGFDRGKPLDRRYIEDFLLRNAKDVRGRVLEIGDNVYTTQYGGARVTHSDILHVSPDNPRATLVGDLAEEHNLPSEAFDCIVLIQTLQYVFDLQKAVATLYRMLRPGGVLLLTVPGVSAIDQEPSWPPLWTLSQTALRGLLGGKFGEANVRVSSYGNVLAAVAFLHGLAESELRPSELDTNDPQYPVIVTARALKR